MKTKKQTIKWETWLDPESPYLSGKLWLDNIIVGDLVIRRKFMKDFVPAIKALGIEIESSKAGYITKEVK